MKILLCVGNHFKHARHLAGKGEKQKMILFSFFPCFHFFSCSHFYFLFGRIRAGFKTAGQEK
jgi:hypothetical protein